MLIININNCLNNESQTKIKAAIFDLDGTLLDTQKLYDEANQELINKYGNGKLYDEEFQLRIRGTNPLVGNKIIIEKFQINLTLEDFMEKKDQYLKDRIQRIKPMEGVKELTHILKHKYGYKMAIATSSLKPQANLKLSIHREWIDSVFDIIITGEDKRIIEGKPSPDIFILSAKELGVRPEECIIFEDAVNGVQAGLNSGASIVVGIPEPKVRNTMENLIYDKSRTKLYIIDSFKNFDYSLIK